MDAAPPTSVQDSPPASTDAAPPTTVDAAPPASTDAAPPASDAAPSTSVDAAPPTSMDSDDDDPVISEVPIYLNRLNDAPNFVGEMYVMQYPLRPDYRRYGTPAHGSLDKVELRQKSGQVRYSFKLNDGGENYDSSCDGCASNMKRQVLHGTVVPPNACSYVVGIIHEGQMVLMPVRAINQLRPDFGHMNAKKPGVRESAQTSGQERERGAESGADDDGDEHAGRRAAASSSSAAPGEEGEPWVRLDPYAFDTAESFDVLTKHVVSPAIEAAKAQAQGVQPSHMKLQPLEFDSDPNHLLELMCGHRDPGQREKKTEKGDGIDMTLLARMPAERQVESLLRHHTMVLFKPIRKKIAKTIPDQELISWLKDSGVCVHGMWVLSSEKAGYEGAEANARDMLLALLHHKKGKISIDILKEWTKHFKEVQHAQDGIVKSLTRFSKPGSSDQSREMKTMPDGDLFLKYPALKEEVDLFWSAKKKQVGEAMSAKKKAQAHGGALAKSAIMAQKAHDLNRRRIELLNHVRGELYTLGAATVAELQPRIQQLYKGRKIERQDLQAILQDKELDAVEVRPGYDLWLLKNTGNQEVDKYRQVLLEMFKIKDSATPKELLDKFQEVHGTPCTLPETLQRQTTKMVAERVDTPHGIAYVLQGTLTNRRT